MTTVTIGTLLRRPLALLLITLASVAGAGQDPIAILDLESCNPGTVGFYWALGSVRFEVVGPEGELCRFDYLWEIEGGYQLHHCLAPARLGRFELDPARYSPPHGGGPWEVEVAIAPSCRLVRSGNLLLEQLNDADGN